MIKRALPRLAPLLLALLLAGCGGDAGHDAPAMSDSSAATAPDGSRPARTLPLPGGETTGGQPGRAGGTAGLVWRVPEAWQVEEPSTRMRIAQYRVPGPGGDAECIVFYFGAGQGGDPMSNARRWANQFTQPDGSSSVERMVVSPLDAANVAARLVEVTGTYDGGMTMTAQPAKQQDGFMLLGGIAEGPDAPWFFKLTGPEETVRAQRDAFVEMMESIRLDG